MKSAVFVLATVALAAASVLPSAEVPTNYLSEVGYPLAQRIKQREDAMLKNADSTDPRIIGGTVAPVGAHPYLAGLVIDLTAWPWRAVCGASMLSPNRLVTAAHCWFDGTNQAWRFEVVFGSQTLFTGGTRVYTSQVVLHPDWTPVWLWNDVAMIYLPTNVAFTALIQPIALPSGSDLFNTFEGHVGITAGYGITNDDQLGVSGATVVSHVNVHIISVAQCQASYGTMFVISSTICTSGVGHVGVCSGDSGGPLVVVRNGVPTLVGVTSYAAHNACEQGHPSGFARVTSFLNFITQHL